MMIHTLARFIMIQSRPCRLCLYFLETLPFHYSILNGLSTRCTSFSFDTRKQTLPSSTPAITPTMSRSLPPSKSKDSAKYNRGLQYNGKVPAFLQKMQASLGGDSRSLGQAFHVNGRSGGDEDGPQVVGGGNDEFGLGGPSKRRRIDARGAGEEREKVIDRTTGVPLPSRPDEGKWAGQLNSKDGKDDDDEDEWTKKYGGGRDEEDGPQIVVLSEGKHLTEDEVRQARAEGAFSDPKRAKESANPRTAASALRADYLASSSTTITNANCDDDDNPDFANLIASHSVSNPKDERYKATHAPSSSSALQAGNVPPPASTLTKSISGDKEKEKEGKGGLVKPKKASEMTKKEKKKEKGKKGLLSFGEDE